MTVQLFPKDNTCSIVTLNSNDIIDISISLSCGINIEGNYTSKNTYAEIKLYNKKQLVDSLLLINNNNESSTLKTKILKLYDIKTNDFVVVSTISDNICNDNYSSRAFTTIEIDDIIVRNNKNIKIITKNTKCKYHMSDNLKILHSLD